MDHCKCLEQENPFCYPQTAEIQNLCISLLLKITMYYVWVSTHHFHIDYNAPRFPPKFLHNYCFQFLLGIIVVPRGIEANGHAHYLFIFVLVGGGGGGREKVHYGLCVQIDWNEMIKITHKVIYKPKGGLTGSIHI